MSIEKQYIRYFLNESKISENQVLDPDTLLFYRSMEAEKCLKEKGIDLKIYVIEEPEGDVYDALKMVEDGSESYGFLEPADENEADIALSILRAENFEAYKILRKRFSKSQSNRLYVETESGELEGTYGDYYKIKELDVEDKEFLNMDTPSRSTKKRWGDVIYTRKDYPLSFRMIDFLDNSGFDIQKCIARAFAKRPSYIPSKEFPIAFDYNRNYNQITTDKINFDWVEENPEAALQKLYNRNRNELSQKYKTYDEFLAAFNSKETDKAKRNKYRTIRVELEGKKDPENDIRKALNEISSKYNFQVKNFTAHGYTVNDSGINVDSYTIELMFINPGKNLQNLVDGAINELKKVLPGSKVVDTGIASYYYA